MTMLNTKILENMYTIPERNTVRTQIDLAMLGKRILPQRRVARVGYRWEHVDAVNYPEWDDICMEIFKEKVKKWFGVELPEEKVDRYNPGLTWKDDVGFPSSVRYEARGKWVKGKYVGYEQFINQRMIWYYPDSISSLYPQEIVKVKAHWLGESYPPSWSSDYWGEYDYDPGGIKNPVYQQFYITEYGEKVHPLDAELC